MDVYGMLSHLDAPGDEQERGRIPRDRVAPHLGTCHENRGDRVRKLSHLVDSSSPGTRSPSAMRRVHGARPGLLPGHRSRGRARDDRQRAVMPLTAVQRVARGVRHRAQARQAPRPLAEREGGANEQEGRAGVAVRARLRERGGEGGRPLIDRHDWERRHSACGGLPPMSRIVGVNNVMAHNIGGVEPQVAAGGVPDRSRVLISSTSASRPSRSLDASYARLKRLRRGAAPVSAVSAPSRLGS